jgi:NADH:ubiquinone oxidoreductase subunit 6 (subunit J)
VTGEALGLIAVAALLLVSSLQVVLSRNLFHSVLWLALSLVATAGVFLLLHAEFLAAAQVLLYAGGVVTIVVFAIMLTERLIGQSLAQMSRGLGWGALVAAAVFVGVAAVVLQAPADRAGRALAPAAGTADLGRALVTDWVLPFEALAVLLVASLLGAVYLARADD